MTYLKTLVIGLIVGIANVIPGVSGSTIAVAFNVYDKFMQALSLDIKKWKQNWKWNIALILGMILGIVVFSKLVTFLFEHFPIQTEYVFTGIVLGSIPLLYNYVAKTPGISNSQNDDQNENSTKNINSQEKNTKYSFLSASVIISFLIGLALMIAFIILDKKTQNQSENVLGTLPEINLKLIILVFVGGILAAIAMIIPGISGSFLMTILGIYPIIICAISSIVSSLIPFDSELFFKSCAIIIPMGIGVLIGLLGGARIVTKLLNKFPKQTYSAIFGLVIGSVAVIFPGFSTLTTSALLTLVYVLCTIAGFCISYFGAKWSE